MHNLSRRDDLWNAVWPPSIHGRLEWLLVRLDEPQSDLVIRRWEGGTHFEALHQPDIKLNSTRQPFGQTASGGDEWPSRDPIGELGGIDLYDYVFNNPANYVDPFGLDPISGTVIVIETTTTTVSSGGAGITITGIATGAAEIGAGTLALGAGAAVVVGGAMGYAASHIPVVGGGSVSDFWGDVIYDAFYSKPPPETRGENQGERNWEKGRGDDWMWELTPDELRAIENEPQSTPSEKARARRIRKQKEKDC